jgi:hypothetical protein
MRASFAALFVILLTTSAFAQSRVSETVIVGRWAIATTYKAEEFESCTMGRSAGELGITFVRERDGLLVVLNRQNGSSTEAKPILSALLPVRAQ